MLVYILLGANGLAILLQGILYLRGCDISPESYLRRRGLGNL